MYNMSLPWWGWALMGAGLVCFVALYAVAREIKHKPTRIAVCGFLIGLVSALMIVGLWE